MQNTADTLTDKGGRELESWIEWRQLCALKLCSQQTTMILQTCVRSNFVELHRKLMLAQGSALSVDVVSSPESCWHLFESHITAGRNCDGKALKQWLFARVAGSDDPVLKVVRGGVRALVRDAFKVNIMLETPDRRSTSMDRPVITSRGSKFNLEELMPASADTLSEVELREFNELADELSREYFEDLPFMPRIVFLAKALRISLSHPVVAEIAGMKKSMLSRVWHSSLQEIAERVEDRFAAEDRQTRILITEMTVAAQKNRIISWSRVEKCCAKLLELGRG